MGKCGFHLIKKLSKWKKLYKVNPKAYKANKILT